MYEIAKLVALVFGITGVTLSMISLIMIFIIVITDSFAIEKTALIIMGIGMPCIVFASLVLLVPLYM